ncbi:MAG: non-canonical purine NTP pyrophosphatase, partial [Bdellovibrionales bacterium]|nr:non-canonical purine NTP pyrophosphatase [Bdellovibrionales bacterium]
MLDLRSFDKRGAQFRCVMVVYSPDGKEYVLEGSLKGEIAKKLQGTTGFGYDPLFIPEGETKTLAELGPGAKNKISHRAQALRKFIEIL